MWNDYAKNQMKQWAINAQLIDGNVENQLEIELEPDGADLTIQHKTVRDRKKGSKEAANSNNNRNRDANGNGLVVVMILDQMLLVLLLNQ